jgi:GNAT superfamily N-acetyltransferase
MIMIRRCFKADKLAICAIINDAAQAYEGRVAQHFLRDPYMPLTELEKEINTVAFYGHEEQGTLVGIMGIEAVKDVTLLRHAYVRSTHQRRGIGTTLLKHIISVTSTSRLLLGTWKNSWAVGFYLKHGFRSMPEPGQLLAEYWPRVPKAQADASVVLGIDLPAGA